MVSLGFANPTRFHRLSGRLTRPFGWAAAAFLLVGFAWGFLVSPPDYQLSLSDADRTVPVADPLTRLVAEFVATLGETLRGAAPPPTRTINQRMQLLSALAAAYAAEEVR